MHTARECMAQIVRAIAQTAGSSRRFDRNAVIKFSVDQIPAPHGVELGHRANEAQLTPVRRLIIVLRL